MVARSLLTVFLLTLAFAAAALGARWSVRHELARALERQRPVLQSNELTAVRPAPFIETGRPCGGQEDRWAEALESIRRDLAQLRAMGSGSEATDRGPQEPTPAAQAAMAQAASVIEQAINKGRWTAADEVRLRHNVAELPQAMLDTVMSKFAVAINQQKLVDESMLEPGAPP